MALSRREYLIPSVLLGEVYRRQLHQKGFLANRIEHLVQDGFYRALELPVVEDKKEREAIAKALKVKGCLIKKISVVANRYLIEHKYDLSSTEAATRKKSVDAVKKIIDESCEMGAESVGIVSGDDPGVLERSDAYKAFIESLKELCEYAQKNKSSITLEALDNSYGRRCLLGPTCDVVEILGLTKVKPGALRIMYDTAHVALNNEDQAKSIEALKDYMCGMHLTNAVLDVKSPLYGDQHMLPGLPGFLTVKTAYRILNSVYDAGVSAKQGLTLCTEILQPNEEDGDRTFVMATDFLKQVILEFVVYSQRLAKD
ncbi:MAG: sugar phosphate isomerase/epimerase [Succinivibrio sp.]|nr:sugar phosphate isomerase/epimerase [Succinivibrio sp.]